MKRRKVKAVIRFHTPSKTKEPDKFYHHLLMLYFPWRKEPNLRRDDQLYLSKFQDAAVNAKLEANRIIFEPNAEAVKVHIALELFSQNTRTLNQQSYDAIIILTEETFCSVKQ